MSGLLLGALGRLRWTDIKVLDRRGGRDCGFSFCRWMVVEVSLYATVELFPFLGYVFAFPPPCGRSLCTLPCDLHDVLLGIVSHAWQDLSIVPQLTLWYGKWRVLFFLFFSYRPSETRMIFKVNRVTEACKQASFPEELAPAVRMLLKAGTIDAGQTLGHRIERQYSSSSSQSLACIAIGFGHMRQSGSLLGNADVAVGL